MSWSKGILIIAAASGLGLPLWAQDTPDKPIQAADQRSVASEQPEITEALAGEARKLKGGRYRSLGDRDAVLASWLAGGLAKEINLGLSAGGRELFGVEFGGQGPVPLEKRPMILLLGGLDGRSLAGCEAVIQIADQLMARPAELSGVVTFVVVPWANPDGLAHWVSSGCGEGRNDRPVDDDGDGLVDEDPADDLDGDGVLMEMLIEDPKGAWVRTADGRFLRPARAGEAPRYWRGIEGRDNDGDGRFNEDQPGGVMLDRNFPVNWVGPWEGTPAGPWPLSEPVSLALAELVLERRTAAVLLYQGNHGQLAMPGGMLPGEGIVAMPLTADLPVYQHLVQSFNACTGRSQKAALRLLDAYGAERSGVAADWFYIAAGALAMEVGIWGPDVLNEPNAAAVGATPGVALAASEAKDRMLNAAKELDQSWARWLDDNQGGLGFSDWQPVDLGDGRQVLIGGWERFTCINPPARLLPSVLRGQADFVLGIGNGLPKFEIELEEMRRNGRIVMIKARVRNLGSLPTGVGPIGLASGSSLWLRLPESVKMVAGVLNNDLGHLPAQGQSASYEWLLVAPENAVVQLEAESDWSATQVLEVRIDS